MPCPSYLPWIKEGTLSCLFFCKYLTQFSDYIKTAYRIWVISATVVCVLCFLTLYLWILCDAAISVSGVKPTKTDNLNKLLSQTEIYSASFITCNVSAFIFQSGFPGNAYQICTADGTWKTEENSSIIWQDKSECEDPGFFINEVKKKIPISTD